MTTYAREALQIFKDVQAKLERTSFVWHLILIVSASIGAVAITYHPVFFGDELWNLTYAVKYNFSFYEIFNGLNAKYKPRIVFDALLALLGHYQAGRAVYAGVAAGLLIWINCIVYYVAVKICNSGRILALILVAAVLTSRFGIMLYFDYNSGILELLSAAVFFTCLLFIWFSLKDSWNTFFAVLAFLFAVLCIFISERYIAGVAAAAFVVTAYELFGRNAGKRIHVVAWAFSLFIVPLLLFAAASMFYSRSLLIGTANTKVDIGLNTFLCFLAYIYNIFFGGNFGLPWYWGNYTFSCKKFSSLLLSLGANALTILLVILALVKQKINKDKCILIFLLFIILTLIAAASLPGLTHQEARWIFPVGVMVLFFWILLFKGNWRYIPIVLILLTNIIYLSLENHDGMIQIQASRNAENIVQTIKMTSPEGGKWLLAGNIGDRWTVGGADAWENPSSLGCTFSKVNLNQNMKVVVPSDNIVYKPGNYNFALLFTGFDAHIVPIYRMVPAVTAMVMTGMLDINTLPLSKKHFFSNMNYMQWTNAELHFNAAGNCIVKAGDHSWMRLPASEMQGRILVIDGRATKKNAPIFVKLEWHEKNEEALLTSKKYFVTADSSWMIQKILMDPPLNAGQCRIFLPAPIDASYQYEIHSMDLR